MCKECTVVFGNLDIMDEIELHPCEDCSGVMECNEDCQCDVERNLKSVAA